MRGFGKGFTIVELLVVIVVIAILAAVSIVAYSGIQQRANNSRRASDIEIAAKAVELYYVQHGSYPVSGSLATDVRTDSNCSVGTKSQDWIPNVAPAFISVLPQSDGKSPNGINTGCYKYWSNGKAYVVSAWIAAEGEPQTGSMYRRLGFREASYGTNEQYYCNHNSMGGMGSGAGPYNIKNDLYKKSYTIASSPAPSNTLISICNETPPSGASI